MESMDRNALMRQLLGSSPGPEHPEHRLTLPSVKEVHERMPDQSGTFAQRRSALYGDLRSLQKHEPTSLPHEAYCRLTLLDMLFGDSTCTVGEFWQRIIASRGAEALLAFNVALRKVLETGCVEVSDPTNPE